MSDRSEATGNSRVSPDSGQKRLIDRLRSAIRSRGYSRRTEKTSWYWIRYFLHFPGKRHPAEMGAAEVMAFLSWLATERNVAAATQNQALSALLFLYKHVLGQDLPWLGEVVHAKRRVRLPVVLTEGEVARLLDHVEGGARLMVALLYGAGLRQAECLALRVKDVDFAYRQILVRDGKGGKDRVTMLPENILQPLQAHLGKVRALHRRDLAEGYGEVRLPHALARKYPRAGYEWGWQFLFPSGNRSADPESGVRRRHHVHPDTLGRVVKRAARCPHRQAGDLPHAAPFVRHAPPRARARHPPGARAARALGCVDDNDLHPRDEQGRARGEKPARPAGAAARRLQDRGGSYLEPE